MRFLIYLLPILYALSPYDFLPDFIVGAGWIDDLIILGLLSWYHFIYRKRRQGGQQTRWRYQRSTEENQGSFRESGSFKGAAGPEEGNKVIDPYQVLGVEKDASIEEIKAAYRRLANRYHPDKVTHLGEEFKILAEKRFKEIQEAYHELSAKH